MPNAMTYNEHGGWEREKLPEGKSSHLLKFQLCVPVRTMGVGENLDFFKILNFINL